MSGLVVATEDELSEAVALRLAAEVQPALTVTQTLRRQGFGYLRSKMASWCQLAQQQPVFLLTDLDRLACPATLLTQWLGALTPPPNLLMRVAVREVESWLLADHLAMQQLLGEKGKLPPAPDSLDDPKQTLLTLAKKYAPRDVRLDLVQSTGAMACPVGVKAKGFQILIAGWPGIAGCRSPHGTPHTPPWRCSCSGCP